MARIDLPAGADHEVAAMWSLRPGLGKAAMAFSDTVQAETTLPIRELEAARIRIAHINGCIPCSQARMEDADGLGMDDAFYANVDDPAKRDGYTRREALAIGFAERFAAGVESFDDAFWAELRDAYADDELVELAACCAKWMGLGRVNAVFQLEVACPIVIPQPKAMAA